MKGYIYFIINNITGQRYVGQSINFSKRKNDHLLKLKENRHINPKLQNAYNKYGLENFSFQKITYDNITKEELNEQEIYYIKKYDSIDNGYNIAPGGTGGEIRNKLDFEDFCFAYFGNLKYKGMTRRTGEYLGVDSACIASIARKESYKTYRDQADKLPEKEKQKYIKDFEEKLDILNDKPWVVQKTLDADTTFKIMCVVSTYGRGIETTILKKFNLSKGFIFHLMTGNGRQEVKDKYSSLTRKEIEEIGEKYFWEWQLQTYTKITLKKVYTDLVEKYKRT